MTDSRLSGKGLWIFGLVIVAAGVWLGLRWATSGGSDTASTSQQNAAAGQIELGAPVVSAADAIQQAERRLLEVLRGQPQQERSMMADRLEAALQALAVVADRIPKDTFDVQAVVAGAGRDPARLFAWVRDETALAPYRGLLRGARGVLMDRVGNSLDRSLLLAALLESAGQDVRLARATLPADKAAEVVRGLGRTKPTASAPEAVGGQLDAFVASYSARFGVNVDELQSALATVRSEEDRAIREMTERAASQAAQLKRVLGPALERLAVPSDVDWAAAVADHWWVQVRHAADWVDYDPILSPQGATKSVSTPAETRADRDIGDDLRHMLRVRVIAEFAVDQQLQESVVLEHTARLSDIAAQRMEISHVPAITPPVFDGSVSPLDGGKTLTSWLERDDQRWTPVLTIGARDVAGEAFALSGSPGVRPASPTGGLFSAFGGDTEAPASPTRHLTAEFVEYELVTPGLPTQVERRKVFDWIGAAARAARRPSIGRVDVSNRAHLLTAVEILPVVAQPSPEYVASLDSAALLNVGHALVRHLRTNQPATALPRVDVGEPHWSLYQLALTRRAWPSAGPFRPSLTQANLLTRLVGTRLRPEGVFDEWAAFDIVFNVMDILNGSAVDRRDAVVAQGVLDTNAESMPRNEDGAMTNITDWMAKSGMSETAWDVLATPGAASSLANASPDLRVLIDRELDAGHVVVVPAVGAGTIDDVGWWRIRRDATVLGIDADGRGGAFQAAENSLSQEQAIRNRRQVYEMIKTALCVAAISKKTLDRYLAGTSSAAVDINQVVSVTSCMVAGRLKVRGLRGRFTPAVGGLQGARFSEVGDIVQIATILFNWTIGSYLP